MTDPAGRAYERRLLILAPVGRDAALIEDMLRKDGIACTVCGGADGLLRELERGSAAVLVTEEALADLDARLPRFIARQPPWSDLPVLLLTARGADSPAVTHALESLGNVTLLERPVRVGALASAVRSALRARERQYQTRAYMEEREQANERKDRFLATLAHELRNPLAPIRNSLGILRLAGAGDPAGKVCEIMERQVNHMVRLVDDLMEVSRITGGRIELRRETVELAAVIGVAVETSRPLIDSARHELKLALPAEPLIVNADPMRLAQVFSNLLNNAAKYTDPGGRISVMARREADTAVVTVSDTGIGIPVEALPRVFDMFSQVDARDSRSQTGLGIGLTLARSLIEIHGGRVSAESEGTGRGSRFIVHLPLSQGAQAAGAAAAGGPHRIGGLPRVLVVDDNRDAADSLGGLLQLIGAEVRVAHDGHAALATYEAFRPGVVLLDLGMPGMDGYEVARRIRNRPDSGDTVLVALTGWGQQQDRDRTRAAGFDHHLVKPADAESIEAVLAVQRRAASRPAAGAAEAANRSPAPPPHSAGRTGELPRRP